MIYALIGISLILFLALGVAALFFAGKSHASSSVEDLSKDE